MRKIMSTIRMIGYCAKQELTCTFSAGVEVPTTGGYCAWKGDGAV